MFYLKLFEFPLSREVHIDREQQSVDCYWCSEVEYRGLPVYVRKQWGRSSEGSHT